MHDSHFGMWLLWFILFGLFAWGIDATIGEEIWTLPHLIIEVLLL